MLRQGKLHAFRLVTCYYVFLLSVMHMATFGVVAEAIGKGVPVWHVLGGTCATAWQSTAGGTSGMQGVPIAAIQWLVLGGSSALGLGPPHCIALLVNLPLHLSA